MSKAKPFSEVLDSLSGSAELTDSGIVYALSSLNRQQLSDLAARWQTIAVERRRALLQHLNAVSEANFELDYRSINHMALQDPDSDVRCLAIEGLWEDETTDFMHKLVEIVRSDGSDAVRIAALRELGRFILLGEYEEIGRAEARLVQDVVMRVLNSDEDIDIRRHALESIANCGREGVAARIRDFYGHAKPSVRLSAIYAMGRTCDDKWAPEIIKELSSASTEMQYEAARAAGHMELRESVPYLGQVIEDTDDPEVLAICVWALGEIGGEAARKILNNVIRLAEKNDDEVILAAAEDALDAASLPGDDLWFMDFEP